MNVPRRSPRRRTVLFVGVFAIVALFVVGTFAQSQGQVKTPRNDEKDPRNAPRGVGLGEINGSNPANDCWMHHRGEGMRDTVIVYPIMPQQLQLGKQFLLPVQIVNPWKQELRDISLQVGIIGEQRLTVEGLAANAAAAVDRKFVRNGEIGPIALAGPVDDRFENPVESFPFEVPVGARYVVVHAEFYPGAGASPAEPDQYMLGYRTAQQKNWGTKVPADNATGKTELKRDMIVNVSGGGVGVIEVLHTGGRAVSTMVRVNWTVVMGGGAASERAYAIKVPHDRILKQSAVIVEVPITPFALGTQEMEFIVRAQNYYKHQDPSTPNEDYYTRYATLDDDEDLIRGNTITPMRRATIGNTFQASLFEAASVESSGEDWKFVMAELSGFAAAGLLVPSLLLGGTYGKGSRRLFNNMLGGAKRRVMFHNIMSLGLSLVAVVHILLFMLEIRYTVLMGVLWGGLGALSLLVLGLTGYYQVPLIQRHGYKWWRFTHLAFGLLVVFFVSYHAIADGPDFFFIKEQLPKWINDINLSQK